MNIRQKGLRGARAVTAAVGGIGIAIAAVTGIAVWNQSNDEKADAAEIGRAHV